MKKQLTNAMVKKVFTMCVALVLVFSSLTLNAASSTSASDKAEVTYKGTKDRLLVFKVDYKNEQKKSFDLIIKDDQNEVLYVKSYDATPLATDVLLSDIPEDCKLTFIIRSDKSDISKSFSINSKVKMVAEYEVKGI